MTDRSKTIEVMARGMCRARIYRNIAFEQKVRDETWVQGAEDAGWQHFTDDAECAYTALQASGMAVVAVKKARTRKKRPRLSDAKYGVVI